MKTQDEVLRYLAPEERDALRDVVAGGMADYDDPDNYGPAARRVHTKSVRAHIRNAHMVHRAQELALGENRFRYTPVKGKPLVTVGEEVSVAFKKLDTNRRPRASRTRQSQAFMGQMTLPLELPPEATNLIAGYIPDKFDAGYEMVLVCPGPTANHWEMELPPRQIRDYFTDATHPNSPASQERRVKVRSTQSATGSTDGSATNAADGAAAR